MANEPTSMTELAYLIPELWSPKLLENVQANLVMAPLCTDRTGELQGSDTVNIVGLGSLTANTKTVKAQTTLQQPTDTTAPLVCATHIEASVLIEDSLNAVSKYKKIESFCAGQGSYAIAAALDTALCALQSDVTNDVIDATTDTGDNFWAHLLSMFTVLNVANVPQTNRFFVVHPYTLMTLLGVDPLISKDFNAGEAAAITGRISRLLNCDIYVTTQLATTAISGGTTYHNLYFHKDAFSFGIPLGPRVQFQYSLRDLGMIMTADMMYGVKAVRPTWAVVLDTDVTT
jgi:hypothetical protein